jgi:hypothetical protein
MPAHDLADHVVQTDRQANGKAGPGWAGARAMAGHVGGYHLVQLLALLALRLLGVRPSWRRTAAAVSVSAGTHALLDRRWPVQAILRATRSPGFAGMTTPLHGGYLADQALHHGVLVVCAAVLAGGRR